MSTNVFISLGSTAASNTFKTWNSITTQAAGVKTANLLDQHGISTGWGLEYEIIMDASTNAISAVGIGAKSWVDEAGVHGSFHYKSADHWYKFTGLDSNKRYTIKLSGLVALAGRDADFSVDGWQTEEHNKTLNNYSQPCVFTDVQPVDGVITLDASPHPGDTYAILAAIWLQEQDPVDDTYRPVTIKTPPVRPTGKIVNGTAAYPFKTRIGQVVYEKNTSYAAFAITGGDDNYRASAVPSELPDYPVKIGNNYVGVSGSSQARWFIPDLQSPTAEVLVLRQAQVDESVGLYDPVNGSRGVSVQMTGGGWRLIAWTGSTVGTNITVGDGLSITAGDWWWLRVGKTATNTYWYKAWPYGTREPEAWNNSATSSYLGTSVCPAIFFMSYISFRDTWTIAWFSGSDGRRPAPSTYPEETVIGWRQENRRVVLL